MKSERKQKYAGDIKIQQPWNAKMSVTPILYEKTTPVHYRANGQFVTATTTAATSTATTYTIKSIYTFFLSPHLLAKSNLKHKSITNASSLDGTKQVAKK